jgi:hypothetical protein
MLSWCPNFHNQELNASAVNTSWTWISCLVAGISCRTVDVSKTSPSRVQKRILGPKWTFGNPDPVIVPQFHKTGAQNDRSEHVLDVGKMFGRWDIVWDR